MPYSLALFSSPLTPALSSSTFTSLSSIPSTLSYPTRLPKPPLVFVIVGSIFDFFNFYIRRFGVYPRIQYGKRVSAATWDKAACLWRVEATDGTVATANVLISGTPCLSPTLLINFYDERRAL